MSNLSSRKANQSATKDENETTASRFYNFGKLDETTNVGYDK